MLQSDYFLRNQNEPTNHRHNKLDAIRKSMQLQFLYSRSKIHEIIINCMASDGRVNERRNRNTANNEERR